MSITVRTLLLLEVKLEKQHQERRGNLVGSVCWFCTEIRDFRELQLHVPKHHRGTEGQIDEVNCIILLSAAG